MFLLILRGTLKGRSFYLCCRDKEMEPEGEEAIFQGRRARKGQSWDLRPCLFARKVHVPGTESLLVKALLHISNCESLAANKSVNSIVSSTALSNSEGEFLLNGDFVVTMSKKEIRVGNTLIEYSGSDNVVERLNCTDRVEQDLLLQVKSWPEPTTLSFASGSRDLHTPSPFCLHVPGAVGGAAVQPRRALLLQRPR